MPSNNYVVMADGCFDPFHVGHARYLSVAADLGGELCVNVALEQAICAKGRAPFQSEAERMGTLRAIKGVVTVTIGDLAERIAIHQPKYLVKGIEWAGRLPDAVVQACRNAGTTIVYTDTRERSSTERLAS